MEGENNIEPINKPFWKKWWIWLVAAIILVSIFGLIFLLSKHTDGGGNSFEKKLKNIGNIWPDPTAKYITAVPIDLTQIQSISKFRSCAGHIRDGYNFNKELENDRSMKHYFLPIPNLQATLDKVKMFAPFDGTITRIDYEKDKVIPGRPHNGGGLHFSSPVDPNAEMIYGHIYTVRDYKIGDKVRAGELVGYAALGQVGNDFDIDLSTPGSTSAYNGREILDSVFDHMTPEVLAEFAKYDITPENTKFTKEYADAHPCNYATSGPSQAQIDESRILLKGRVPEVDTKKDETKK